MQTTLRLDDEVYRAAKSEAARLGVTITRYIEDALREKGRSREASAGDAERNRLMEQLLQATAHFRVGAHPSREEMNGR